MHWIRRHLTYANVMSSLAVFLVLGGAAFAATQLPKNSVGTKQLKKNAVTSVKVKNHSLKGIDLKLSSLGTVPSAKHATSADTATQASSADSATHATSADSATDATTLDGKKVRWMVTDSEGKIAAQSGGFSIDSHPKSGLFLVNAGSPVAGHAIVVSDGIAKDLAFRGVSIAGPCGLSADAVSCVEFAPNANDGNHILVVTTDKTNENEEDHSFYLVLY